MQLSYLQTVSLLAVVLPKLNEGDCARLELSEEKVAQSSLHYYSHGKPVSERPSLGKDVGKDVERMPKNSKDSLDINEEVLPAKKSSKVLGMDRNAFKKEDEAVKRALTQELTAKEWNELLERFWAEDEEHQKNVSVIFYTELL